MRADLQAAEVEVFRGTIPNELHLLAVTDAVIFPGIILPYVVSDPNQVSMVHAALRADRLLAVFLKKDTEDEDRLYPTGTVVQVLKMFSVPDGSVGLLLQGIERVRFESVQQRQPHLTVCVSQVPDDLRSSVQSESYRQALTAAFDRFCEYNNWVGEDLKQSVRSLTELGEIADMLSANLNFGIEDRQAILDEEKAIDRAKHVLELIQRDIELAELSRKIQQDLSAAMDKNQKEYYLREQLKVIRSELGEDESTQVELEELMLRFREGEFPDPVKETAERELKRLARMNSASSEYSVARSYVDWLAEFPWCKNNKDSNDLTVAREVLDRDHYGLEPIKERILEFLAVRKLTGGGKKSPILCFVGPPGVGKTSLGHSIASSLGREFIRLALGGVHDESEIRGHRRTYVGAMPGRIAQKLRESDCLNPVFMLDEIDKLGQDVKGDPASALLEVLDPAQNHSFSDHYLELPIDLSNVMFIATANEIDRIPGPLRDRMEIIHLPGYLPMEKMEIARRYLVPRQLENTGMKKSWISFLKPGLKAIIEEYTREAGVRQLEQKIGSVARKQAKLVAENGTKVEKLRVDASVVRDMLGTQRILPEVANRKAECGVATGMAWTPYGGAIMFIECTEMPGNGRLRLTGRLGEVMQESGEIAMSYIRSHAVELGIPVDFHAKTDLHVHFPEGATPKDGPSAGITIITALVSLLSGRKVRPDLSMTGEVSLRGQVLPIGGLREKVMAAHRAGIRVILAPADNAKDLTDIPAEIRKDLKIHFVSHINEVLKHTLV
jgi:ATP-dependent Lon protease